MADSVSKESRTKIMRRIRGKDTKPELAVRKFLHRRGFRFRIHQKDLPGAPDVVLKKYQTVIFVHGCFWHQHPGCYHSGIPLSNTNYWKPKLERTIARDKKHRRELENNGWRVETTWECEIEESSLIELANRIKREAAIMNSPMSWEQVAQTHGTNSGINIANGQLVSILCSSKQRIQYENKLEGSAIEYVVPNKMHFIKSFRRALESKNSVQAFKKLRVNQWLPLGHFQVTRELRTDRDGNKIFLLQKAEIAAS